MLKPACRQKRNRFQPAYGISMGKQAAGIALCTYRNQFNPHSPRLWWLLFGPVSAAQRDKGFGGISEKMQAESSATFFSREPGDAITVFLWQQEEPDHYAIMKSTTDGDGVRKGSSHTVPGHMLRPLHSAQMASTFMK
ncbi:hypothetical protein VZT92_023639 [Zoarces viviparus]|uniref:Uncharacterized protein n=1 Tax=Zoarces viviparus TaxID=48416 RepID=A0AAW1E6Y9_ZOAVI